MSGQGGTKVIIIKKKGKHGGHHGGAWKVAYADFVTAMMALFIVLWLLTQSDQASKERISQYFRTGMLPGGTLTVGRPAGSSPPVALNIFPSGSTGGPDQGTEKALATEINALLKSELENDPEVDAMTAHMQVKVTTEGTLIELVDGNDNFMFSVGGSGLKPNAIKLLQKLAPIFAKMRNKLEIHGHTDGRPFEGNAKKGNWDLSFERANEARRVLESSGVASGKITAVQAHADSQLINRKDPLAPENRRLALLILKDKPRKKKPPAAEGGGEAQPAPQGKE
ncbi:MAG: flagellar motor protein MotB [Polyangiales bacterium]